MDEDETPEGEEIDMMGAMQGMQQGMSKLMMLLRFLPWLPSLFIMLPVTLIALTVIVAINGEWNMLIYLLEALIVGLIAAVITRYTIGRKIEKGLKGGLMPF